MKKLCEEAMIVAKRLKALLESGQTLADAPDLSALAERAEKVATALRGVAQMRQFDLYQ